MSHLGLISSIAAAEKGFKVICFDKSKEKIDNLKHGIYEIEEPDLERLATSNHSRLHFTSSVDDLSAANLVYISLDVPTDKNGKSHLSCIKRLIELILPSLLKKTILVILCQVPPGFTEQFEDQWPSVYYQVETLIFGKALSRALFPERIILGCKFSNKRLPVNLEKYLSCFECPILKMRIQSAELAKISINMCLVSSISVANTLAEICENTQADWSEIVPALKLDKRIGPYSYLNPGLGIAGGNLERDLKTVLSLSNDFNTDSAIVRAWIKNSNYRKQWVWRKIQSRIFSSKRKLKVALLGLAYKENTNSIKNSASLKLLTYLSGCNVVAYDPVVKKINSKFICSMAPSLEKAIKKADIVCIMTPWEEFKKIELQKMQLNPGVLVVDPYRVIRVHKKSLNDINYVTLGIK